MTRRGDAGMVTAELAVVLPAVVIVLVLALGGISAGVAQLRCVDAARTGARALARGEPPAVAMAAARSAAPRGTQVSVRRVGDGVEVTVSGAVALLGSVAGGVLDVPVRAVETAEFEPGAGMTAR